MERCGSVLLHTDIRSPDNGASLYGTATGVDVAAPPIAEEEVAHGIRLVVAGTTCTVVCDGQ